MVRLGLLLAGLPGLGLLDVGLLGRWRCLAGGGWRLRGRA